MLIAVRFARIFRGDDTADFLFDAFARHIFAVAAVQSTLEKELELEKASAACATYLLAVARLTVDSCMSIFFGDVAQHHGLEVALRHGRETPAEIRKCSA